MSSVAYLIDDITANTGGLIDDEIIKMQVRMPTWREGRGHVRSKWLRCLFLWRGRSQQQDVKMIEINDEM